MDIGIGSPKQHLALKNVYRRSEKALAHTRVTCGYVLLGKPNTDFEKW